MFNILKYDYPTYWDDCDIDNDIVTKKVAFLSEEYLKCFIEWVIPNPDFNLYRVQHPAAYGRFILWKMHHEARNLHRGLTTTFVKSSVQEWNEDLHANFDQRLKTHVFVDDVKELFPLSSQDVVFVFNQFQQLRDSDKNFCPFYAFSKNNL